MDRKSQLEKSTIKVNGQQLVNGQRSTAEAIVWRGDDVNRSVDADAARADVAEMMTSADQAPTRGSAWRRVIRVAESLSGAWGRVRSLMAARVPRMCRSALDDLNGTFKNEIGAIFAAVMQRAVVCVVWHSLTTAAASPEPKDDDWMTSKVQRQEAAAAFVMGEAFSERKEVTLMKTKLLRKGQSSGSDTMLEI